VRERRCKAFQEWEDCGRDFTEHPRDLSYVEAFIKKEFVKPGKFCHIIGSRNDVLQCLLGPAIAACGELLHAIPGLRTITATSVGKGRAIADIIFGCENVLEIDYTAWDSTVSSFDLELVDYIYQQLFPDVPDLGRILAFHSVSTWSYSNACRYTLTGTRVSGDSDTTVGNSFLHWCYCVALLEDITNVYSSFDSPEHFEVAGDDGVIGLPCAEIDLEELALAGKQIKAVYRLDPDTAQFCSGLVMQCQVDGMQVDRLYRLPGRTVGRIGFTPDAVPESATTSVLEERTLAEIYACSGSPITSTLAECLHQFAVQHPGSVWRSDRDVRRRLLLEQSIPICEEILPSTRVRFAKLYGISVPAQLEVESHIKTAIRHGNIQHPLLNFIANDCA